MFSGTTFTNYSGNVLGGHQKIDRSAYSRLSKTIDIAIFPSIRQIITFEGRNGPDGIKAKSPGKDEPWHYFNPFDKKDTGLIEIIDLHYHELVTALREGNREKSAFEAAWLAHAVVDGLTPSHHYPYEAELERLRGGEGIESRDTVIKKLFIPGDSMADVVKKNWEMWGAKGLLSTHALFDWGASLIIAPLQLGRTALSRQAIARSKKIGVKKLFLATAKDIAEQEIYEAYYQKGWTKNMTNAIKNYMAPHMIETLALVWYLAVDEAKSGEAHF